ncbi:hypothetical protein INT44_007235 [Umbelopsis vinacea]|uniref:Uncharacterized protein n=1 Tax=Umbelopsis vinacea TaxID=44442 RepID=A0A8H7UCK2_9FUNG|nr:hypothetical protein INT44_007235 [Umbelopsis vinacea]
MASFKTTAFIFIYVFNLFAFATAYLNEAAPPFTILTPKSGQSVKRGSNVTVTWRIEPYTRWPIYGYAAAKSARTIAGLLDINARGTDPYVREVDHNVPLTEGNYSWVVGDDVMPGEYRFGLGFYRHEASPIFTVVE